MGKKKRKKDAELMQGEKREENKVHETRECSEGTRFGRTDGI